MELLPIFGAISVGSAISFGFAAMMFGILLHGPGQHEPLPDGYTSWTACNTTLNPDTTALGEALPFHQLMAWVSIPKFFMTACLWGIFCRMMMGSASNRLTFAVVGLQLLMPVAASVFVAGGLEDRLPPDAVISGLQLVFCFPFLHCVAPIRNPDGSRATCQSYMFYGALCISSAFVLVVINTLNLFHEHDVGLVLTCFVCLALIRIFDVGLRLVFKTVFVQTWICVGLLYMYQSAALICLRRYTLQFIESEDLFIASATTAGIELACNLVTTIWVVHKYNGFARQKEDRKALRYLNLFLSSVISETVCEHVALNATFACSLFVDDRVFSIQTPGSLRGAFINWSIQLAFEVVCDTALFGLLFGLLPLSSTGFFSSSRHEGGANIPVFFVVISAWTSTVALQNYVKVENFRCGTL